jgi:hypothetical protein
MVGNTISHYRRVDKLGQGRMREVLPDEDANLDRQIAIKVLPDTFVVKLDPAPAGNARIGQPRVVQVSEEGPWPPFFMISPMFGLSFGICRR